LISVDTQIPKRCMPGFLLPAIVLLVSCSDIKLDGFEESAENQASADAGGSLSLSPPDVLLQARMVNPANLVPRVSASPGGVVSMTTSDNASWSGTLNVPVNSQVTVLIDWYERLPDCGGQANFELRLANHQQSIDVGTDALLFPLSAGDYNTDFHEDNDEFTNLQERRAGTDPCNSFSAPPPTPGSTDPSVQIPFINDGSAPLIDGLGAAYNANALQLVGEWANAVQDSTSGDLFIDSLMIGNPNNINTDPLHAWAAQHDGTYLYLLVMVDDATQSVGDSPNIADDDSIEIFIDGNNSNLTSYGDADDRFFKIALVGASGSGANSSSSPNPRISRGSNSAPVPATIEFATGLGTGPLSIVNPGERLDVYELRIELASFGLAIGQPFGLEVQINDDDDGGSRDYKWGWSHPQKRDTDLDLTVNNPAFMGTALLSQ